MQSVRTSMEVVNQRRGIRLPHWSLGPTAPFFLFVNSALFARLTAIEIGSREPTASWRRPVAARERFSREGMMGVRLLELAMQVGGTLQGDGSIIIEDASTIEHAAAGHITFACSNELSEDVEKSEASAAVVPTGFPEIGIARIEVADPTSAFARIVKRFRPPRQWKIPALPADSIPASSRAGNATEIHPTAVIGEDVVIGDRCRIHAGVVIGDGCTLADDVTLFPRVVLYEKTTVGSRVIIHAGAVIGAYGFGYRTVEGRHELLEQLGHVEIESDVEIGAGTTIDRGSYDATIVGEGTKIDNLVMVGHNCRIGRHNLICSQAGIAGSCTTGDYVVLAGQAGLADHIRLGDMARVAAKSGIMQDVPDGQTVAGLPAMPERDFWRLWANVVKVPEMRKKLRALDHQVKSIEESSDRGQRDAA